MEAGLLSAEANNRRITKNATVAGKNFVQKSMEVSTKSEAEEKVLPTEEAVDCSQEIKDSNKLLP